MYLIKAYFIIKYLFLYSINFKFILVVGLNKYHFFLVMNYIKLDWVKYLAVLITTPVYFPILSFKPIDLQLFVKYSKYLQVNWHLWSWATKPMHYFIRFLSENCFVSNFHNSSLAIKFLTEFIMSVHAVIIIETPSSSSTCLT